MITFLVTAALAGTAPEPLPELAGEWVVDLSVDPDEPYTRPMTLELNDDGSVGGLFYQSAIEDGRWTTDRGRTCASFRTRDGRTAYQTAVCLVDGKAIGQTWAEDRQFLFNWDASRAQPTG